MRNVLAHQNDGPQWVRAPSKDWFVCLSCVIRTQVVMLSELST